MGQDFNTLDELRLEVSTDPAGAYNLIENTDGTLGTWSWFTPGFTPEYEIGILASNVPTPGSGIKYTHTEGGVSYFVSDWFPIIEGQYARAAYTQQAAGNAHHKYSFEVTDAAKAVIQASTQSALIPPSATADTITDELSTIGADGIAYVRLRIDLYAAGGGAPVGTHHFHFTDAAFAVADTEAELSAVAPGMPGLPYANILHPVHQIEVDRPRGGAAMLTATVVDPTLDPATDDTVRPGRRLRLVRADGEHIAPPMVIRYGNTSYTFDKDTGKIRTRIEVVAFDTATPKLAGVSASDTVLEISDLDHVAEPAGVPWNFNGNTDHLNQPDTLIPSFFGESLPYTVLGVLGLLRDTWLGYLWLDRRGVITLFDREEMPALPVATFSDDGSGLPYTALDPAYSTQALVNTVKINQLVDPVSGAPNVVAGPYVEPESVAQYGTAELEVTVFGLDPVSYVPYAELIFEANALPKRRIGSLTMPVRSDTIEAATTLDLNDLVHVTFGTTYDADDRISGIRHRISAGHTVAECRWFVDYTFESPDTVTTGSTSSSGGSASGGSGGGGTPIPVVTRKPTVFYVDEHTVTEAGPQEITLTYVPKDYSEHLYWHHRGHGGIFWADNTWTREGNVVTVPDAFGIIGIGDVLRMKYALLHGQTAYIPEPPPAPEPDPDPGATLIVPDNAVVLASEPDYEGSINGAAPQWGDSNDATYALFRCRYGTSTGNRRQRVDTQLDTQPGAVIDGAARIALWFKIVTNDHTEGFVGDLRISPGGGALATSAGSSSGGLLAPAGWTVLELTPTTGNTITSILTGLQTNGRWLTLKHLLPSPDPAGTFVKETTVGEVRLAIYYP